MKSSVIRFWHVIRGYEFITADDINQETGTMDDYCSCIFCKKKEASKMSGDILVLRRVTWQGVALGVVLGIVFGSQIRRIPGVGKIPTI